MAEKKPEDIEVILATDCGSTTTKAILIEKRDGQYRLIVRGEAPTTVEAPFEDVTMGVLNAVGEVEELSGRKLLGENERIISPRSKDGQKIGTDIYISTSSAGGGLQMMVAGVVRSMTAESAERAALGAGAIVMDLKEGIQYFSANAAIVLTGFAAAAVTGYLVILWLMKLIRADRQALAAYLVISAAARCITKMGRALRTNG